MATTTTCAVASEDKSSATLDFRLRYETVDQDNAKKDANALTLRTLLTFKTASYNNFSGVVEFEDSRAIAGIDDYNDTNGHGGDYSVIADPETTELDQGYLQYKRDGFVAKLGRQVITLDNHRFVGHVGWRQDKQTFDAASFTYQASKAFSVNYAYLSKRNRIFGQEKDIDSKDHLFNAAYKTELGKLTAYGYLLEVDNNTSNSLDTFGIRFAGKKDKLSYSAEYAMQESKTSAGSYDADYLMAELGYNMGKVTAKAGIEILGSDNGQYGFATPLATLHKFNGWSDQFLATPKQGLSDIYISFSGKVMSGKWVVTYHDFSADENSVEVDDLGSEVNLSYGRKFAKTYSAGIKYAAYSAGDEAAGKVDTDKLWLWVSAKF